MVDLDVTHSATTHPWRHRLVGAAMLAAAAAGAGAAVALADGASSAPVSAAGTPVKPSPELLGALAQPELAAFRPDAASAQAIDAPGGRWVLVRGAAGALCVDLGDVTVTCADAPSIAAGELAVTTVSPPAPSDELALAQARRAAQEAGRDSLDAADIAVPGAAVRRGVVADGVTEVRAIGAAGQTIAKAAVTGNTYRLDAGVEGAAAWLELVGPGGSSRLSLQ